MASVEQISNKVDARNSSADAFVFSSLKHYDPARPSADPSGDGART